MKMYGIFIKKLLPGPVLQEISSLVQVLEP